MSEVIQVNTSCEIGEAFRLAEFLKVHKPGVIQLALALVEKERKVKS